MTVLTTEAVVVCRSCWTKTSETRVKTKCLMLGIHFSLTEFVFISRDYNVYPVSLSICVPVHS